MSFFLASIFADEKEGVIWSPKFRGISVFKNIFKKFESCKFPVKTWDILQKDSLGF